MRRLFAAILLAVRRERVAGIDRTVRRREHERRLLALQDGIDHLEERLAARGARIQQLELVLLQAAEIYTQVVDASEAVALGWPPAVPRPDDVEGYCRAIRRTITAAFNSEGRLREDALLSAVHRTAGMAIDVANADAAFIARLRQFPAAT